MTDIRYCEGSENVLVDTLLRLENICVPDNLSASAAAHEEDQESRVYNNKKTCI